MIDKPILRLAAILVASGVVHAAAAPATPEEAQRLTALFERYVGRPAGPRSAVAVVPNGDGYTATFDITEMFAFTAAGGTTVTAVPLTANLTPQADGHWRVAVDGFPQIGVAHADQAFSFVLDSYKFDGLFDPAIRTFATATTTTSGSSTRATGKQGPVDVKLTDTGASTTSAEDAGSGTVNVKSASSLQDVDYAITAASTSTSTAVVPSATTRASAASIDMTLALSHAPIVAIEDLWQFLVAHPSKPELAANQGDLKTRLKALIPLSTATVTDLKLSKIAVETSLGHFGLDALAEHYDDTGPDASGGAFTRLAAAGLQLPPGLLPTWGEPLLPTSVDIGETYGPIDLKPALFMAIDDLDLSAGQPFTEEQKTRIAEAFSTGGRTITFTPSTINTATLTLTFTAALQLTKPLPTGSGTVSATGLDKTIDAVRAASPDDPMAAQAVAVLMAAKAIAKAEGPDSYTWQIGAAPGGAVTVNGMPLGGPAQQPPAVPP